MCREFDLNLRHNTELLRHLVSTSVVGEDGIEKPFRVDHENYWIGEVAGECGCSRAPFLFKFKRCDMN